MTKPTLKTIVCKKCSMVWDLGCEVQSLITDTWMCGEKKCPHAKIDYTPFLANPQLDYFLNPIDIADKVELPLRGRCECIGNQSS